MKYIRYNSFKEEMMRIGEAADERMRWLEGRIDDQYAELSAARKMLMCEHKFAITEYNALCASDENENTTYTTCKAYKMQCEVCGMDGWWRLMPDIAVNVRKLTLTGFNGFAKTKDIDSIRGELLGGRIFPIRWDDKEIRIKPYSVRSTEYLPGKTDDRSVIYVWFDIIGDENKTNNDTN